LNLFLDILLVICLLMLATILGRLLTVRRRLVTQIDVFRCKVRVTSRVNVVEKAHRGLPLCPSGIWVEREGRIREHGFEDGLKCSKLGLPTYQGNPSAQ
jgi:hypothetical protein